MRTRPRGFTLMEVLLALALVLALLGSMFAFLYEMLSTRAQILAASQRRQAAAILVDRVERDLMTCIAGDPRRGAGVRGDATSLAILSRDVPVRVAARGGGDGSAFADLERSEYRYRGGTIEARRSVVDGDGPPESFHALGAVPRLHFRFFDGSAWQESYDSLRAGGLPVAVEVAVWFQPWPGEFGAPEDDLAADFEDDPEPARRTFDANAGFDEAEFARVSDFDTPPPAPDRVRVILVPDARVDGPVDAPVDDRPAEEEVR